MTELSREEFVAAWNRIMARLTPDEREVVETVLLGAEVNHSALYAVVAAVLGVAGGWCLCALFGG